MGGVFDIGIGVCTLPVSGCGARVGLGIVALGVGGVGRARSAHSCLRLPVPVAVCVSVRCHEATVRYSSVYSGEIMSGALSKSDKEGSVMRNCPPP